MTDIVDEFCLQHFGVKGMRWGVINEDDPTGERARNAKRLEAATKFMEEAQKKTDLNAELQKQGIDHPEMKRLYGKALDMSDRMFLITYGYTKESAVKSQVDRLDKQIRRANASAEAKKEGKLTPTQKKVLVGAIIGTTLIAAGVIAYKYDVHLEKTIGPGDDISVGRFMKRYSKRIDTNFSKPIDLSKLHDNDYIVPKGSVFNRITAFKDEDLARRLYATHIPADNDKYAGLYGPMLRMRTGESQLWVSKMVMGEEIRSPSPLKRVQMYAELLEENSRLFSVTKDDGPIVPSPATMKKATENYYNFARYLVTDSAETQLYFDKVKKAGYNALIDDNDAGQLADAPIILLNASKTVASRTFEELTPAITKVAKKNLVDILDVVHAEGGNENMDDIVDDFLEHFGVKGMKWGVRKNAAPGVTSKTNREASKDAQEFARAKLFYGEGAGNRRKLIKAKVEAKSKRDPKYKEAFDHHLARQDLGKHANKAQSERKRKDVKKGVGKTARGINRAINGPFATPLAATAAVGVFGLAKAKGYDKVVMDAGRKLVEDMLR